MILVTGATGQIGSELVPEMRRRFGKQSVIAGWHLRQPSKETMDGPALPLDVTRTEDIEAAVKKYPVGAIYHLGAVLSAVAEQDPVKGWQVNFDGLYNVLEVARKHDISRIFYPSSIAVFGAGVPRMNTPQLAPLLPTTMYGIAKVSGELLGSYYTKRYGMDVRSLRYPGIISSVTPPGGGTTDYNVHMFYEAIKRGKYECFVRADTVLPMMYMPDCIKAALDVMDAPKSKIKWRFGYNVTSMSPSAEELAAEIRTHIPGFRCTYKPDFRQAIADSWPMSLDDTQASKDWGWRPAYDLASMTEDMIVRLTKRLKGSSSA